MRAFEFHSMCARNWCIVCTSQSIQKWRWSTWTNVIVMCACLHGRTVPGGFWLYRGLYPIQSFDGIHYAVSPDASLASAATAPACIHRDSQHRLIASIIGQIARSRFARSPGWWLFKDQLFSLAWLFVHAQFPRLWIRIITDCRFRAL